MDLAGEYLRAARAEFGRYRTLGEKALAQIGEPDLFRAPNAESNPVAVIVKHLRGNMLSRWTDFLTTDGEKPDRRRDSEFELEAGVTRDVVMRWWEEGWSRLFASLDGLGAEDLERSVRVRGEELSVPAAVNRQLAHTAYHVGQIVYLAKSFAPEWRSLSIPRGQSEQYRP